MEDLIDFTISSYDIDYLVLLWQLVTSTGEERLKEKIEDAIPMLAEKYSLGEEMRTIRDLAEAYDTKLYDAAPGNKLDYFVEKDDWIRVRYCVRLKKVDKLFGMREACRLGKQDFIEYFVREGVKLSEYSGYAEGAAEGGHLEQIQWLLAQGENINKANIAGGAAFGGYQFILEWLFAQPDYKQDFETTYLVTGAARHPELVKWLYAQGYHGDEESVVAALEYENLDLAKWLYEQGCPLTVESFISAVIYIPTPEALNWLYAKRCPWDETVPSYVQNLESCIWLHEHGCPWDAKTTYNAAYIGDAAILEYASKNGCPWHPDCYKIALEEKQYDVVAWILRNRSPSDYDEDSLEEL